MKVKLAATAGFCWGVKRAIDITLNAARGKSEAIYTFGPLIHNPQLIKLLESSNIHAVDSVDGLSKAEIIIRTHGITPRKREEIESAGHKLKNATCPLVAKVQGLIRKFSRKGFTIIIVGDEGHAEIIGLKGFAQTKTHVISSPDEVASLPPYENVFVAAQTTCDKEIYRRVIKLLKAKYSNLEVGDTICDATTQRQEEVVSIASEVDAMVVVGGRNSANTSRLASIAKRCGVKTFLIETAQELDYVVFNDCRKIGVTAGASTPKWIIDEVMEKLGSVSELKTAPVSVLGKALDVFAKSNLLLALGATALASANMLLMGITPSIPLVALPFCAVAATLLLNKVMIAEMLERANPRRYRYHIKYRGLFMLIGFSSLATGFYFARGLGNFPLLLFIAVVGPGVTYGVPIGPLKKLSSSIRLKNIPASKELFMGLAWGVITALMPYVSSSRGTGLLYCFFFAFCVAYIRSALFGLRDIQDDQIIGREAIPIVIGKKRAFHILYGIIFLLVCVLSAGYAYGALGREVFGLLAGAGCTLGFIIYNQSSSGDYPQRFDLAFDSHYLLVGIFVYLLHIT